MQDMNVQLEQTPIKSDKGDYNPLHATNDLKFNIIINKEPEINFKFPAKLNKDQIIWTHEKDSVAMTGSKFRFNIIF